MQKLSKKNTVKLAAGSSDNRRASIKGIKSGTGPK